MTHEKKAPSLYAPVPDDNEPAAEHNVPQPEADEEDEVDRASRESFPASDPPAWNAARSHIETTDNAP